VLAAVIVDPIDLTLNTVPAQAGMAMAAGPDARARFEGVELRRSTWM
jgi:hypothetical protein